MDQSTEAGIGNEVERIYREQGKRLWWSLLSYSGDRDVATDSLAEVVDLSRPQGEGRSSVRLVWPQDVSLLYVSVMHDDGYFNQRIAATYDESSGDEFDRATIDATVDFLAELARGGPALELAIGTGRIALPLAARGVPVWGIDLSRAMVAKLREKSGGEEMDVTIGDFSTTRVEGAFSLVYLVFNTICNLTTQEAQVACFRNAAAHLEPGGCFLIEVGVPALRQLPPGEKLIAVGASDRHWGIDEYDVATQGLVSHELDIVGGEILRTSVPFRYVWPSELDLMAQMAGMRLRERWEGWNREPFTSESRKHVSVWEKPRS